MDVHPFNLEIFLCSHQQPHAGNRNCHIHSDLVLKTTDATLLQNMVKGFSSFVFVSRLSVNV